jgi:hypothetical protein
MAFAQRHRKALERTIVLLPPSIAIVGPAAILLLILWVLLGCKKIKQ